MSAERSYTKRDLAEARKWAKDFVFVDCDNYAHNLDEDKDNIPKIAELIAKVRRGEARRQRRAAATELDNRASARAFAESLGAYR